MVPVTFHDFFGGCASASGALIGLLFVAISVSPQKLTGDSAHVEHQVRAAAAFSALVSTLVIALVSLLPGANLGEAGIIVAAAGLATSVGLCVLLLREHRDRIRRTDVSMLAILLILYGLQLASAIQLDRSAGNVSYVSDQGALLIGFFLFGIARSWQLVGARDTSLMSTLAAVIHGLRQQEGDHAVPGRAADQPDSSSEMRRQDD